MVVEPDTQEVEDLPFVEFGRSPDVADRVEGRVFTVFGFYLKNDCMTQFCGFKVVNHHEELAHIGSTLAEQVIKCGVVAIFQAPGSDMQLSCGENHGKVLFVLLEFGFRDKGQ